MSYRIYKLTAPSGRFYVGVTCNAVEERWKNHTRRALRGEYKNHPLYNSIRKYGPDTFQVETLAKCFTEAEALEAEKAFIASTKAQTLGYNISAGGDYDWRTGVERLAELRKNPNYEADYRAKLSAGIRASEAFRARSLTFGQVTLQWRAENPRMAYKMSSRAIRIAQRAMGIPPRGECRDFRFSRDSGRLAMPGSKKVAIARSTYGLSERVKAQWARRSEEQRQQVARQISEAATCNHAKKTPEQRAEHNAQLAEARKNIDHDFRKARQKEALAAYWTPERKAKMGERSRQMHAKRRASSEPTTS